MEPFAHRFSELFAQLGLANDQDATLHPFNNTLADQYLIIQILAPSSGQFLIQHHPLAKQAGQNCRGKEPGRNQSGLEN